jgi:hypothetical protein
MCLLLSCPGRARTVEPRVVEPHAFSHDPVLGAASLAMHPGTAVLLPGGPRRHCASQACLVATRKTSDGSQPEMAPWPLKLFPCVPFYSTRDSPYKTIRGHEHGLTAHGSPEMTPVSPTSWPVSSRNPWPSPARASANPRSAPESTAREYTCGRGRESHYHTVYFIKDSACKVCRAASE